MRGPGVRVSGNVVRTEVRLLTEEVDMKRKETAVEADRRSFLKLAGLGAVASSATLVAGEASVEQALPETAAGYRETDHVKTFYKSARF